MSQKAKIKNMFIRVLGNAESGVFFTPTFDFVHIYFPAGDSNLRQIFLMMSQTP